MTEFEIIRSFYLIASLVLKVIMLIHTIKHK